MAASSTEGRPNWIRLKSRGACDPNWDFWGRTAAAPLWRWVCVAFRVEPESVLYDASGPTFYGVGDRFQGFNNAIDLGLSAIRARHLRGLSFYGQPDGWTEVTAIEFWIWWKSNDWEIPKEMLEGLSRQLEGLSRQAKMELARKGVPQVDRHGRDLPSTAIEGTDELADGWDAIASYLASRFNRTTLNVRTARRMLKDAGIAPTRKGGRVSVSKRDLDGVPCPR